MAKIKPVKVSGRMPKSVKVKKVNAGPKAPKKPGKPMPKAAQSTY
jgi:hypothetical protein